MKTKKISPKKLAKMQDEMIASAWGKYASGIQINIMDIPQIYHYCRSQLNLLRVTMTDETILNLAVNHCIARYRKN